MGTYLYKYNLTVLFVSPSKIAHDKFYIYCPPLLLNEIYAHGVEQQFSKCRRVRKKKKNAIAYHIFQTGKYVFDTCCDLFQSDI